jgi:uncharacterized membrane protein
MPEGDPATHRLVEIHETVVFVMAGLATTALLLRLWRRNRLAGAWRASYLGLVSAATVLVLVAGHFGAKMVFGPDYLPF